MMAARSALHAVGWVDPGECRLEDFRAVVERTTDVADYPFADSVEQGVLIYSADLVASIGVPEARRAVQAELIRALLEGPGVVVFKHAFEAPVVDRATERFEAMIAEQHQAGRQRSGMGGLGQAGAERS
jgi:hypothetical protein